jgi:RNA polymerase sigma-70 factor (ECF subfamily)
MMALERLSPVERAAFLVHDVFGVSFEEVAETIERQLATASLPCDAPLLLQLIIHDRNQLIAAMSGIQITSKAIDGLPGFAACSRPGSKGAVRDRQTKGAIPCL